MKKLSKVLAVAVFAFMPFIVSSSSSATGVCNVGYTGPDSQNLCRSETKYACSVNNNNDVKIVNSNNQEVASGNVSNSNNQLGGDSTSGSVTNNSGTTFAITIKNPGFEGTCAAQAVVPATEQENPVTPVTPTISAVQPTVSGGDSSGAGGVAVLPETNSDFILTALIVIVSSLAATAALGIGGVALYRYYKFL
jgi:hypothetical protein